MSLGFSRVVVAIIVVAGTPRMATSASRVVCASSNDGCILAGRGGNPDPCFSMAGCYSYWVDQR